MKQRANGKYTNVTRIGDHKRMMRERSKREMMRGDDTTMTMTTTRISRIRITGTGMLMANHESHDDLKSMRSERQSIGMFCTYLYTRSLSRTEHSKVN